MEALQRQFESAVVASFAHRNVNAAKRMANGGQYSKKRRQRRDISRNMAERSRKNSGRRSRAPLRKSRVRKSKASKAAKHKAKSAAFSVSISQVSYGIPLAAHVHGDRLGQQHVHVVKNQAGDPWGNRD